ncbi:MAG: type II toxin-antitoxin system prevent-host-death family antitoxin [Pseudohongiella sp.]|nr:type II toxin-antitoxin system prevent-host-death family antitoxin [Pseudohongiella sp.]
MQTVSVSELRANLLMYMEKAHSGELITVTSHGRVLATISPPVNLREQAEQLLGTLSETAEIYDVVSPSGERWDVTS